MGRVIHGVRNLSESSLFLFRGRTRVLSRPLVFLHRTPPHPSPIPHPPGHTLKSEILGCHDTGRVSVYTTYRNDTRATFGGTNLRKVTI